MLKSNKTNARKKKVMEMHTALYIFHIFLPKFYKITIVVNLQNA